jgi:hypothetical protein
MMWPAIFSAVTLMSLGLSFAAIAMQTIDGASE